MRIRLPNANLWRCGYFDFAAAAAERPIFFCFMLDLLRKFCRRRPKFFFLYLDTAAVVESNMLEVIKNRDTMFCLLVCLIQLHFWTKSRNNIHKQ